MNDSLIDLSSPESFPAVHLLYVMGNDRASFLHNFCTNNINDLAVGQVCEAFFTDVKAKVLGHGYVAAGSDLLAIMTVGSDISRLQQHLSRYVITEDVTIETIELPAFALCGQPHGEDAQADIKSEVSESATLIATNWDQHPVAFLFGDAAQRATWTTQLVQNGLSCCETATAESLADLRIREGYPVVDIDVSSDNMAPEAARIKQAISYTKGCYLGQEPIARLDAMGHVNRQLYRGTANVIDEPASDDLPTITSFSPTAERDIPFLTMLKVSDVKPTMKLRLADGRTVEATVKV